MNEELLKLIRQMLLQGNGDVVTSPNVRAPAGPPPPGPVPIGPNATQDPFANIRSGLGFPGSRISKDNPVGGDLSDRFAQVPGSGELAGFEVRGEGRAPTLNEIGNASVSLRDTSKPTTGDNIKMILSTILQSFGENFDPNDRNFGNAFLGAAGRTAGIPRRNRLAAEDRESDQLTSQIRNELGLSQVARTNRLTDTDTLTDEQELDRRRDDALNLERVRNTNSLAQIGARGEAAATTAAVPRTSTRTQTGNIQSTAMNRIERRTSEIAEALNDEVGEVTPSQNTIRRARRIALDEQVNAGAITQGQRQVELSKLPQVTVDEILQRAKALNIELGQSSIEILRSDSTGLLDDLALMDNEDFRAELSGS